MNCSSNDQVCWEDALPSEEWELPEDGAAACGAIGGRKAAAGCENGNGAGNWKPSGNWMFLLKGGKLRCLPLS